MPFAAAAPSGGRDETGRLRGCGTDSHAVAPLALGPVQRVVRPRDGILHRFGVLQHRHPETCAQSVPSVERGIPQAWKASRIASAAPDAASRVAPGSSSASEATTPKMTACRLTATSYASFSLVAFRN